MDDIAASTVVPWPYRGRPRQDELFSSWFLRAAHAMDIKPYALGHISWRSSPPPLTRDIDGSADERVLTVMSRATLTPMHQCRQTLLSSYQGFLFETHQPLGRTSWIMPVGVRARTRHHPGLQFCPACMVDTPTFRRLWRVGWATVCVSHRLRLLDRCSQCASILAPLRAVTAFACHNCGAALADSEWRPASDEVVEFQRCQETILAEGWGQLGESHFPYSVQYFQTLRRVARVVAFGPRSAALREEVIKRWGGDGQAPFFTTAREVETLDADHRYRLFDLVARVIQAWPCRFIAAASSARLWQSWAMRDGPAPPFVYADVVSEHLTRTAYSPSIAEVEAAADYLRRRQPGFTRRDLIRLVGDSENVAAVFAKERRRRRGLLMAAMRRSLI
ncbi:TniQ family protein [uncultured Brevundimonas sp.]|uniref:TniQ family protein n=1 Tax=uncultured Brevundimonas sp. TaxID=213418 RepID=UPI0025F27939|nr:TniQ family protein [uncultured Brevundimonas sp.]